MVSGERGGEPRRSVDQRPRKVPPGRTAGQENTRCTARCSRTSALRRWLTGCLAVAGGVRGWRRGCEQTPMPLKAVCAGRTLMAVTPTGSRCSVTPTRPVPWDTGRRRTRGGLQLQAPESGPGLAEAPPVGVRPGAGPSGAGGCPTEACCPVGAGLLSNSQLVNDWLLQELACVDVRSSQFVCS